MTGWIDAMMVGFLFDLFVVGHTKLKAIFGVGWAFRAGRGFVLESYE